MKILITGGHGFIARNLTEHLKHDHTVTCLGRTELDLLDATRVSDHLASHAYDVVIHAATYDAAPKHSIKNPALVLENNLKMFFHIARCHQHFGRMLYFGSGAEFCRAQWTPRMTEGAFDRHVPPDPYGFSKYLMNLHAQASANIYNLRLFGVFGPNDDWRTRFLSNACCRAVMGQPIVMNQNRIFDHLYMGDLARIAQWFLTASPKHHDYNVCSGTPHDFMALAHWVRETSAKPLGIIAKTPGMGLEYSGDNTRLLSELGEFSFTPMPQAIAAVYQWHDENRHLINPDLL
jgi:nucleoside-diphosphate-sugar epimerase